MNGVPPRGQLVILKRRVKKGSQAFSFPMSSKMASEWHLSFRKMNKTGFLTRGRLIINNELKISKF